MKEGRAVLGNRDGFPVFWGETFPKINVINLYFLLCF